MSSVLISLQEEALKKEMYNRIASQLKDIRAGRINARRIVLVVPAQSTLMAEEEGFKALGDEGFFDFLIMSGARLREEILKECGSPGKTVINTIGRRMLLRKIAGEKASELTAFRGVCQSDGFLDLAADFIVQAKQNNIAFEDLSHIAEKASGSSILKDKLLDMQLICTEYELAMAGKYTDSENLLAYTASAARESRFIKESIIWYWGFYSFTQREYDLLKAYIDNCADFNAAVLAGSDRYAAGKRTAEKLSSLGLVCEELQGMNTSAPIKVKECSSVYSQSEFIACDILRRVRDDGLSYGDVMVLTGESGSMAESLKRTLGSFGIPVFMDEKRSMQHTAAAEIVSYSLNICSYGFRRQDVLGLLKTGIFGFDRDLTDRFENYCKEYKIYDKAFLSHLKYGRQQLGDDAFAEMELVRKHIAEVLLPFSQSFGEALTVRDKTSVLYAFLADIRLPSYLESLSSEYQQNGFLDIAEENIQSWDLLVGLMDQMVALLGDSSFSPEEYSGLLASCFADIKIGVLPQAKGSVRIGSITRSVFSDIKTLYIAGFNDGLIPSEGVSDRLLTEDELSSLAAIGIIPAKNSKTLAEEELFQIERALDTECEEIVLCCCSMDSGGESLRPSPLLENILSGRDGRNAVPYTDAEEGSSFYIQNKESVLAQLPRMLKDYSAGGDMPEEWKLAYNTAFADGSCSDIVPALFFKAEAQPLKRDTAENVFKKRNGSWLSPTELEQYSSCPFKHFIDHGLAPEELREFSIDSRNAGTIYHSVLLEVSERLTAPCRSAGIDITDPSSPWMTADDEYIEKLVKDILESGRESMLSGVMGRDASSEYRTGRIASVCCIFAEYMVRQVRKGKVSAMYFETGFGRGRTFPPISVETPFGTAVIEGQIDRVDILSSGENKYVKIIDYKSGTKEFSLKKVKAGLDLQLMIYMEGALGSDESLRPGGVFYYAVRDPERESGYIDVVAEELTADFVGRMAADFALDGIVVNDSSVLSAMDTEITDPEKVQTDVFEYKNTKTKARIISPEDMENIRSAFKGVLSGLCGDLYSGCIDIRPAIYEKKNIACTFCDFSSICMRNIDKR